MPTAVKIVLHRISPKTTSFTESGVGVNGHETAKYWLGTCYSDDDSRLHVTMTRPFQGLNIMNTVHTEPRCQMTREQPVVLYTDVYESGTA